MRLLLALSIALALVLPVSGLAVEPLAAPAPEVDAALHPSGATTDSHSGLPGLGALDGWVDVHGDTMSGTLTMGNQLVQFSNGALAGDSAGPGLRFAGAQVCTAGSVIAGCAGSGDISAVNAGAGLAGGGASGDVTLSVATGGIVNAMLAANAVDGAKVLDGSIAAADVNAASVQLRVTGACAVGQYLRVVAQDGSVTCGSDANSGGTVTSVGSGAGLAGGPITGSGTLSVATGGIVNAMLAANAVDGAKVADGSLRAADVDGASIQLRVTGTCAPGNSIRAVASDGTVTCEADDDSGGTVTSVASGAGLTGGPITGTGTLSVATGGITNAMLAADAVDTSKVLDGSLDFDDLGNNGCTADAIMKQDGISWVCASDAIDGGNAAFLDGLNEAQFLRSDAGDTYFGTALVIASGSNLDVQGQLRIGTDISTNNDTILFDDSTSPESIAWVDGESRFVISDEAAFRGAIVTGGATQTYAYNRFGCCSGDPLADINSASDAFVVSAFEVGGLTLLDGDAYLNADGAEGNASLFFYNGGARDGESLRWDDAEDRFEFSDAAFFEGAIRTAGVGNLENGPRAYNTLGGLASEPVSAFITSPADLFVQNNVEVRNQLALNGTLYMKGSAATGQDGDQAIDFYNANSRVGESLMWDDSDDRFEFSDEVALGGPLLAGSTAAAPVGYHRIGGGTATNTAAISNLNDLFVTESIEAANDVDIGGALVMHGGAAEGSKFLYFYEDGSYTGEALLWDDGDDRFETTDDLAVPGTLQVGTGTQQAYNRIGSGTPEANIGASNDLLIGDSLQIGGTAYKPGGGSWTATSDARVKRDVRAYTDGLAFLRGIDPVWFTYNGLGGTPEGLTAVGVLAQDLEPLAPYMVGTYEAKLHPGDAEPTTLYHVDPSAFTYASINAIQELDAKVVEQQETIASLEGRLAALEDLLARLGAAP